MLKRESCLHRTAHECQANVIFLKDSQTFTTEITIKCANCGLPFRFVGVDPGSSPDGPRVNISGVELRCPIEPEEEIRLFSGATYVMPE